MSDHDMPPNGVHGDAPDPVDEAYREAEALLSDDAARAARRARVLAAVSRESDAPPAAPPSDQLSEPRRAGWARAGPRWAPWLVAASVAALGLFVTAEIWRPLPPPPPSGPPPATGSAPQAAPVPSAVRGGTPPALAPTPATPQSALGGRRARVAAQSAPAATSEAKIPAQGVAQAPAGSTGPRPPSVSELSATAQKREQQLQRVPVAISAFTGPQRDQLGVKAEPSERARRAPSVSPPPPPPPPPPAAPPVPIAVPAERAAAAPRADAAQGAASISEMVVTAEKRDPGDELRAAAAAGRTGEVRALLGKGAPVDAADEDGDSALMRAVEADQPATAALLVRHGASLDLRNGDGQSARDMAASKDDPKLNRALGLKP